MCLWKIRGQVALCWQIKIGQLMLIYSISVLPSSWKLAVQKFLYGRQMFLPYWKVHFPEEYKYMQDGLITGLKFKLQLEVCQVLTASKNRTPGILCFEFSCEQLVHPGLFEQQLVALIISSAPFYLLGKIIFGVGSLRMEKVIDFNVLVLFTF